MLDRRRKHAVALRDRWGAGVLAVHVRVFDASFDNFLRQLVDEALEQLESAGIQDVRRRREHPRNRLLSVLRAFRCANPTTPLLLLIDQFERLFEESRVRIDETLMRDVWRRFQEVSGELNSLNRISFVITARQHFFWVMFPSDSHLRSSSFRYLTLRRFQPEEAAALLDRLLELSGHDMDADGRQVFLEKTDHEPQLMVLAFINTFVDRDGDGPAGAAELLKRTPWDGVFRREVELIRRDRLQELIVFAMANIGRELCEEAEIAERVRLVEATPQRRIRDALFEIQNTHRLIKQPRAGKYAFYHRNVGEWIAEHYRTAFPEAWVHEGFIWDLQKMVEEEERIHQRLGTLIDADRLVILDKNRKLLQLDDKQVALIVKSCVARKLDADPWITQAPQVLPALEDFLLNSLEEIDDSQLEAIVELLGRIGSPRSLKRIAQLVTEKEIREINPDLAKVCLAAMHNSGFRPTDPTRLGQCLVAAIYVGDDLEHWRKIPFEVLKEAVQLFLASLDEPSEKRLVSATNIPALSYAARLVPGAEERIARFVHAEMKRESTFAWRHDKSSLAGAFRRLMALELDRWLDKMATYQANDELKAFWVVMALFVGLLDDLAAGKRITILWHLEGMHAEILNWLPEDQRRRYLLAVAKIALASDQASRARAALEQISLVQCETAGYAELAEELELWIKISDDESSDVLKAVRQALQVSEIDGTELVGGLIRIAGVSDAGVVCGELLSIVEQLLKRSGRGNWFHDPQHHKVVGLLETTLKLPACADAKLADRHLTRLLALARETAASECNAFLAVDLVATVVLHWERSGIDAKRTASTAEWCLQGYRKIETSMLSELNFEDLWLRAEALRRYGAVAAVLGRPSAEEIKRRALRTFHLAITYFETVDDDSPVDCQMDALELSAEINSGRIPAEDIYIFMPWVLEEFGGKLWERGQQQEALELIALVLDTWGEEAVQYLDESYLLWLERAAVRGVWDIAATLCRAGSSGWYSDWFFENAAALVSAALSGDGAARRFVDELLGTDEDKILRTLVAELLTAGSPDLAQRGIRQHEKIANEMDKDHAAMGWFSPAFKAGQWALAYACWQRASGNDELMIEASKMTADLAIFLVRDPDAPAARALRARILAIDDVELLQDLGDTVAQLGEDELSKTLFQRCDEVIKSV
ncbi:MAG: hypothetical protein GY835_03245 [bacterium]|nr:hypothetical protein [bacterium]